MENSGDTRVIFDHHSFLGEKIDPAGKARAEIA
jgi:hypothetical protein